VKRAFLRVNAYAKSAFMCTKCFGACKKRLQTALSCVMNALVLVKVYVKTFSCVKSALVRQKGICKKRSHNTKRFGACKKRMQTSALMCKALTHMYLCKDLSRRTHDETIHC